jgi:hypothetical protein
LMFNWFFWFSRFNANHLNEEPDPTV